MRVAFHTLGCKVNQYETEAMQEQFAAAGYTVVAEDAPADLYVINTCTVTHMADRKSRQYIRRKKHVNPDAIIAVTGCYAQMCPEEVQKIDGVDIVAGTGHKQDLLDYVETFCRERQAQCHVTDAARLCRYRSDGIVTSMESRTRAYLKIQEGCNRYCAYCVIPYARGPVRSRDPEEILREAAGLADRGFRELVLTGINTALYGAEAGGRAPGAGLADLLAALDRLPGTFRVRLSSLEPTVVRAEDVEALLGCRRLCRHLHLSAQSGSDGVLRRMHRNYDRAGYLEIVEALRRFDPCYGITTDLICGFPGETETEFADTLSLTEAVDFGRVHVFPYSRRAGTAAASMPDQIPAAVKRQRCRQLTAAADAAAARFFDRCVGTVRQVLLEEATPDGLLSGYADNYVRVWVEGPADLLHQFCQVKLVTKYQDGMKGVIVNG